MVEAILMAISMMWLPVGLLLLGYGEAKGTGALVCMVGTLVLVSAVVHGAVFKDPYLAALLFAYGLFYCIVGFALYNGLEDMSSVGNASFTLIPITSRWHGACSTSPKQVTCRLAWRRSR